MLSNFVIVISANHMCMSVACSISQPCPSGTLLERTATLSMGAIAPLGEFSLVLCRLALRKPLREALALNGKASAQQQR